MVKNGKLSEKELYFKNYLSNHYKLNHSVFDIAEFGITINTRNCTNTVLILHTQHFIALNH